MNIKYYLDHSKNILNEEGVSALLNKMTAYPLYKALTLTDNLILLLPKAGQTYLFIFFTKLRVSWHHIRWNIPAKPYNVIFINPKDIRKQNHHISMNLGLGQIKGGNWDKPEHCTPLEDQLHYKSLKQRFELGYDWEQTDLVKRFENASLKKRRIWEGFETLEEFINIRCSFVDELFVKIRNEGYHPNSWDRHIVPEKDVLRQTAPSKLEPLVTIGNDGEIYWKDGIHRLTIAQILNIKKIPVNVVGRHKKWQEIREEIFKCQSIEKIPRKLRKYLTHPDLEDVVSLFSDNQNAKL